MRPWALVGYLVLLAPVAMLGYGADEPGARLASVEAAVPGIYSHASNLALSVALALSYGLVRLLTGATLREVVLFTALVAAANYAYELWLPLFNTRDVMDAHYGLGGALAALTFLVLVDRYGLRHTRA